MPALNFMVQVSVDNINWLAISFAVRSRWFMWIAKTPLVLYRWTVTLAEPAQAAESDGFFGSGDEPCTYLEMPRPTACDYCNMYRGCSLYRDN